MYKWYLRAVKISLSFLKYLWTLIICTHTWIAAAGLRQDKFLKQTIRGSFLMTPPLLAVLSWYNCWISYKSIKFYLISTFLHVVKTKIMKLVTVLLKITHILSIINPNLLIITSFMKLGQLVLSWKKMDPNDKHFSPMPSQKSNSLLMNFSRFNI